MAATRPQARQGVRRGLTMLAGWYNILNYHPKAIQVARSHFGIPPVALGVDQTFLLHSEMISV